VISRKSFIILAHQNIRSYSNKTLHIANLVAEQDIDILCLTETWLNSSFNVCLPIDYEMVRRDRNSIGGGVAVLFKKHLKCSVVNFDYDKLRVPHSLEICICNFQYNYNKSFIVVVVYRTNLKRQQTLGIKNDLANIEYLFAYILTLGKTVYVLGDFNFNLCEPSNVNVKKFMNIFNIHNLKQLVNTSTRDNSLLDLILTNNTQVDKATVYDTHIGSDHFLVSVTIPILKTKDNFVYHKYRDFKNINTSQLDKVVVETFSGIYDSGDMNEYFDKLCDNIKWVFDSTAPVKDIRIPKKRYNIPISDKLKKLKHESDCHYKKWKSTVIEYHFNQHKTLKKQIKNQTQTDFKEYVKDKINKVGIWDTFQNVFNLNFKSKGTCDFQSFNVNELNEYYVRNSFNEDTTPYNTLYNDESHMPEADLFFVDNVTLEELKFAWKRMKKRNSTAIDETGLCKRMINVLINYPNFENYLLDFCNSCFSRGRVPDVLKIIRIVPIPKIENASTCANFRPIGISPFFMSLLERLYYRRLCTHVSTTNILSKYQFGCRTSHSTEHAMIALTDTVKKKIDIGMVCAIVSLDLKNAFPSVHREILLQKIKKKYKISDYWLRSYFSNRKQFVNLNGKSSEKIPSLNGLIQGSVLGPVFFTFFINDIVEVLDSEKVFPELYVDDSNFLFYDYASNIENFIQHINFQMREITSWVNDNCLSLNSNKTKLMFLGSRKNLRLIGNNNTILVNNTIINACNTIKCLGLNLDSNLSYENHVYNMVKICNYRITSLYKIQQYIPDKYRELLATSFVTSILRYMANVWFCVTKKVLKRIEKVIRSLARFVLTKGKFDNIASFITNELKWFFPEEMCMFQILCTFKKLIKDNSVQVLSNDFLLSSETNCYRTRSTNNLNYCCPTYIPRTNIGYTTFHFKAVSYWNGLPLNIKMCSSFCNFKELLSTYLLQRQKNRLLL